MTTTTIPIETLTEGDRDRLDQKGERKALRIIDAHAAERAALTEQVAQLTLQLDDTRAGAARRRAEVEPLRAENARLTEQVAQLTAEQGHLETHHRPSGTVQQPAAPKSSFRLECGCTSRREHGQGYCQPAALTSTAAEAELAALRERVATALVLLAKPVKPGDVNEAREVLRGS